MTDTPVPVRTYEISFEAGGSVRIDLPETYKVTFGPILGAGGKEGGYSSKTLAFRAWEAETKQRLLLTGVAGFRDVSLPAQVRAVRKFGAEEWFVDDGTWVGEKAALVQRAWRPLDDVLADDPARFDTQANDDDELTIPRAKTLRGMTARPNRPFTLKER